MSTDADLAVAALDLAAECAAASGRGLAGLAGDADGVERTLTTTWTGASGRRARREAGAVYGELHELASTLLYICDVLRVEGASLARALAAGGDDLEVDDADRRLAGVLEAAVRSLVWRPPWERDAIGPVPTRAGGAPAAPDDPRAVPGWWHSLGPDQRSARAREHPGLGGLDGLPAATRDAINRERLDRLLDAGTAPAAHRAFAGYLAEDPRRMLLDVDADGRAVVADGDPDTASRVVTFVPGTGSGAKDLRATTADAAAVCVAAEAADPDPDDDGCVSVSWFDYPAPPDVPHAAVDRDPAREGAPRLRDFLAGADAAGDAVDNTGADRDVVGYSYGSVVVGSASAGPEGVAAGTQVHVASPGTSVESLAGLRVDADGVPRPARADEVVGVRSRWDVVPWWTLTGSTVVPPTTPPSAGGPSTSRRPGCPPPTVWSMSTRVTLTRARTPSPRSAGWSPAADRECPPASAGLCCRVVPALAC